MSVMERTEQTVTLSIIGPNIPGNQGETFHVHAADCADLRKPRYRIMERSDNVDYDSLQSLVEDWFDDQLSDNAGDPDGWGEWPAYVGEFKVFPCVKGLPTERPGGNAAKLCCCPRRGCEAHHGD